MREGSLVCSCWVLTGVAARGSSAFFGVGLFGFGETFRLGELHALETAGAWLGRSSSRICCEVAWIPSRGHART